LTLPFSLTWQVLYRKIPRTLLLAAAQEIMIYF